MFVCWYGMEDEWEGGCVGGWVHQCVNGQSSSTLGIPCAISQSDGRCNLNSSLVYPGKNFQLASTKEKLLNRSKS